MFDWKRKERVVKMQLFLANALVGLVCCIVHAQATPEQLIGRSVSEPANPRYEKVSAAMARFLSGDVSGARSHLTLAKRSNPELPPVGVMLSKLYFMVNQSASARAELEKVVVEDANDPEAYLVFADVAWQEGRYTEAETLYSRGFALCNELQGNDFRKANLLESVHAGLNSVAAAREQWDVAESQAREWLKINASSALAQSQLGRALFHQQQYQSAFDAFKEAHKLNSQSPRPEINMALLYEELVVKGDKSKRASALAAMKQAAESDPQGFVTRLSVARWALEACEIDMAESNAKAAADLNNESLDARLILGLIARHRKDYELAENAFREIHIQAPANFEVVKQLSLALVEQIDEKKQQLALDYAELSFRANPDLKQLGAREAAVTLAWVLYKLGRAPDALATVRSALTAGNVGDESTYLAARILSETGQSNAASQILEPVLRGDRCFPTRADAEKLLSDLARK